MRNPYTRGLRRAAAVVAAATMALIGSAGAAHAAPSTDVHIVQSNLTAVQLNTALHSGQSALAGVSWNHFINVNSGYAMAVGSSSDANGAAVIQWNPNYQSNGLPGFEQAWTQGNLAGVDGTYPLLNAGTNPWKALAIGGASTTPGAKAIQWTYEYNHREQQWKYDLYSDGSFSIKNDNSNLCLAIGGASRTLGAAVIQWTCSGHPEQRWHF